MRPVSIIFLVISLLLIITGSVICHRAEGLAADDGFNLLEKETDENGNSIKRFDFAREEETDSGTEMVSRVSKLSVKLNGVDVEIHGGAAESYVEVYNKGAIFNCYISNKVMTVSNIFDIAEMIESSGSNFEFNGIRKYLDFSIFKTKETKVFIYLSSDDPLKQVELQLENCNASMSDVDQSIDVIVEATGATVSLRDIQTESSIQVTAKNSTINATDLLFTEMHAECENCDFTLDETNYSTLYPIGYTVTSDNGELIVNDAPVAEGVFTWAATTEHHLEAIMTGGKTTIKYAPTA